jgi:hypothetical protein
MTRDDAAHHPVSRHHVRAHLFTGIVFDQCAQR